MAKTRVWCVTAYPPGADKAAQGRGVQRVLEGKVSSVPHKGFKGQQVYFFGQKRAAEEKKIELEDKGLIVKGPRRTRFVAKV